MSLIPIKSSADDLPLSSATAVFDPHLQNTVSDIIANVIKTGDKALIEYTQAFDQVSLDSVVVPKKVLLEAKNNIPEEVKHILESAIHNIKAFHLNQKQSSWEHRDQDDCLLGEKVTPLDRVGIYVPGGKAFYPSTLIMNAIPAQLAGVPSILVASPPDKNGLPHPLVLGICAMLDLDEVMSVGGAQAVAAMAYGTDTIPSVCKITGPGNRFVAEAKRQVFGKVGIDSIAGPSEIVVLHDDTSIPTEFLVRDLLTQAEHDEDATAILITTCQETAQAVQKRLDELVPILPRREIIENSLKNNGAIIHVKNIAEGAEIVNRIAPEHLELMVKDRSVVKDIRNAGAIFIGRWSSETIGDYFAGPNHTIPTSGAAKYASPLSVRDFQKHSSLIEYSKKKFTKEADLIASFAKLEGLEAHAEAVLIRKNQDDS